MIARKYWVVGDVVDIRIGGSETNGEFAVIETTVLPGGGPPLHTHHREHESFYVIEGEIEFTVDGKAIIAPAGSLVHGRKGIPHRFQNKGASPAKMLVHLCPAGFEEYFVEVGTPVQDPNETAPAANIEKLIQLAPKYGLEFHM